MSLELRDLHTKLALELADCIENGEKAKDAEGKLIRVTPSPALLNVARQFLKDNNIQATVVEDNPLDKLAKAAESRSTPLPFEGADALPHQTH